MILLVVALAEASEAKAPKWIFVEALDVDFGT